MPYAIWNHNQLRCRIPGRYPGGSFKKLFSTEIKRSPAQYLWSVGHHHGNQPYYHVKKSVSRGTGPYRGNGHRRTSEPGG